MSINGITPAQYRAAWRSVPTASAGNSAFDGLLAAAGSARGSSSYQHSAAAEALKSATKESYQLPNGLWTTADGGCIDNSKFTFTLSASMALNKEFDAWKAGRPPVELPDSGGLTEANLAYLRQRYTGSLSEFERMEVLQALLDVDAISRQDYNSAMGYGGVRKGYLDATYNGGSQGFIGGVFQVTQSSIEEAENSWTADWYRQWEAIHVYSPFAKFESLDDIFTWADSLPEKQEGLSGLI